MSVYLECIHDFTALTKLCLYVCNNYMHSEHYSLHANYERTSETLLKVIQTFKYWFLSQKSNILFASAISLVKQYLFQPDLIRLHTMYFLMTHNKQPELHVLYKTGLAILGNSIIFWLEAGFSPNYGFIETWY